MVAKARSALPSIKPVMLRCMRRQLKRLDGIFSAATRLTPGPQFRSSMVVLDGERRAGGDPIRPIGFAAPGGRTTLGRACACVCGCMCVCV